MLVEVEANNLLFTYHVIHNCAAEKASCKHEDDDDEENDSNGGVSVHDEM